MVKVRCGLNWKTSDFILSFDKQAQTRKTFLDPLVYYTLVILFSLNVVVEMWKWEYVHVTAM